MGYGPGERNLNTVVTYWADTGVRDDYNEPTYASPVTLHARWVDMTAEAQAAFSEEIKATTEVFLSGDVAEKGFLAQGDQTAHANPHDVAGAREIQGFKSFPDLRTMNQQRKAFL